MRKFLILGLFVLCQSQMFAQKKIEFENELLENSYYRFAKIKTKDARLSEIFSELTMGDKSISYKLIQKNSIDNKIRQEKYQLFKDAVKVRGAEYVITFNNEIPDYINGFLTSFDKKDPNKGKLSMEDAIFKGQR